MFERLFLNALEHGRIPAELSDWRQVAHANGGVSFSDGELGVEQALRRGLFGEARSELQRLEAGAANPAEVTYRASLAKLVRLLDR